MSDDWWSVREEAIDLADEAQELLDTGKSDAEDALALFESLQHAQHALHIANEQLGLS